MKVVHFISILFCLLFISSCSPSEEQPTSNLQKACATLDSLYANYSVASTELLRENYPFDEKFKATYLASEEQANVPNQYSYLWPYSGTFSAVNALYEATKEKNYLDILNQKVLPGLEAYYDTQREPYGYASYINSAPQSDRFYDDNVWLGIDFTDLYRMTNNTQYLDKAKIIWNFVISGTDDKLGGGIYWCEQKKTSKNTCSNAPGSVFAFKLFEVTNDSTFFYTGQELYEWTKKNLQDTSDYLYFDNIQMNGKIGKAKYAYNSGQMMQSAVLQYKLTNDPIYLEDAEKLAEACYNYFFVDITTDNGNTVRLLKKGDIWFSAVMLRGFVELYTITKDKKYIDTFDNCLDYAWENAKEKNNGLFNTDLSGKQKDSKKWLLTQAAMVEMYARLSSTK